MYQYLLKLEIIEVTKTETEAGIIYDLAFESKDQDTLLGGSISVVPEGIEKIDIPMYNGESVSSYISKM